jgi:hypothetical protein
MLDCCLVMNPCEQAAPVATVCGQHAGQAAVHMEINVDDLVNDLQSVRIV